MMNVQINCDILQKSKKWNKIENPTKLVNKITQKLILLTELKKILKNNFTLELSILLVSDSQIKKINNQFRQKDKPTNVLSFPALDTNLIKNIGLKKIVANDNYIFLGDIVISFDRVYLEANLQKKTFENHLTHLILHSILHLIGFDHKNDEEAKIMEDLEIKILKTLKITNPY